jgi:hypothetical protein
MPGYAGQTDLSLRVAGNVLIGMCKRPDLRGKEDDRQQNTQRSLAALSHDRHDQEV